MNTHPMKYVGMIDKLLKDESLPIELRRDDLVAAKQRLINAASEEAAAYGEFKDIIKQIAKDGHPLAIEFNDNTYLDLT